MRCGFTNSGCIRLSHRPIKNKSPLYYRRIRKIRRLSIYRKKTYHTKKDRLLIKKLTYELLKITRDKYYADKYPNYKN